MISIAMDCRKISDGGIGTYIRNLLRCWKRQKVEADFYLFAHSSDISRFEEFRDFANIIFHDYPKYSIRELFSFSKPLKKMKIDLFFCLLKLMDFLTIEDDNRRRSGYLTKI